ncbi:PemK family protein [Indibacter alkaliphilus LW1]|uniref:mRNA interferase n=1 Tax=Indibacter alkaliphilus (strain CCUG 57479 / KCTC 22604 / LW1) TaxID=1189612 RepID=S2DFH3_INDAL|nr:type II toxin-antitoxin system PemK/MazF family toxin [Indibacter alkaliphilus]EOZ95800.1 PemK family protein [Indibacter alkaliphilus LW1]
MKISQYDIVLVNLDPTLGSEMKKTRPCLVLSPNEMNKFLKTIVISPITSGTKPYPTRVQLDGQKTSGWVAIDQIRTIDRVRIIRKLETLNPETINQIKSIIRETFVD